MLKYPRINNSRVSVVIPCYNHGEFIADAIDSVHAQTYDNIEIIVVNDGSTDRNTLQALADLEQSGVRLINQVNAGLASARNAGIAAAEGDLILPLDADDRIAPGYLEQAVSAMLQNDNIGIVYGMVEFFGERSGLWQQPDFSLRRLSYENMIVATALFRRTDWERVGGYRRAMVYGWEDWDFWLSIVGLGREVFRIPEVVFFYRIRTASMTRSMGYAKKLRMLLNMAVHHRKLYLLALRGRL